MKNWKKGILGVALSFMILFTALGYAGLSDTLSIIGNLFVSEPKDLYITNVDGANAAIAGLRSMTATLSGTSGQTVTYTITVKNNTKTDTSDGVTYAYTGSTAIPGATVAVKVKIGDTLYPCTSDENAAVYVSGVPIEPSETRTIVVTYTLTEDITDRSITVDFDFAEVKYKIEYINDSILYDTRCVLVNENYTDSIPTANSYAAGRITTAAGYNVIGWQNAGTTHLTEIPNDNTEDIQLYPVFENLYTAIFVELDGTIIAWDTFTTTNYQKIKDMGDDTTPSSVDNCVFDYWEVHVTKNGTTTTTALSAYTFADGVDITIYPVYTYQGDVNLIPVDTDGDGTTNEYHVAGYSKPEGQAMVVIPESVMGIPVTAIQANALASYDGIHSVVIPKTVTSIGDNAFAETWSGYGDNGETVTIYYAGSYADWQAVEPSFDSNWERGFGDNSRIFFLNGGNTVYTGDGYLQAKHSGVGSNKTVSWEKTDIDSDLIGEYTGYCDCKNSTEGDTAHIYVDAAGNVLDRNSDGTPVNSSGTVISYGVIKEGFLGIGDEYGLTDGTITTYKRYRPDKDYWTGVTVTATASEEETTTTAEETTP